LAENNAPISENGISLAEVYKNKALSLYHLERYEEALKSIVQSLDIDPKSAQALDIRCLIHYRMNNNEDALEDISKAISIRPNDKTIWYHKGIVQLALKEYKDAQRCFDRAISIEPKFAEAYNAKGAVLTYLQDNKSGLKAIKKAIELKPSLPSAHENLAKLSLNVQSRSTNFVEFWKASLLRITIAIIICLAIASLVVYSFSAGGRILEVHENIGINGTSTITSITRTEFAIQETTIVVIGILVLILLLPEIRKAKVGSIEFELSPREAASFEPSVDFVEYELHVNNTM
jgi:tetratricopeptide (TPR) repeat protein